MNKLKLKLLSHKLIIGILGILVLGGSVMAYSGSATTVIENAENVIINGVEAFDEALGGEFITTIRDFTEGISVDGNTVIDGSGNINAPITSTTGTFSSTLTVTGNINSTSGRYIAGVETGGTCSSGLVIDLSSKTKGNLTTIGETNTACAISFTNGTVGEAITLSHDYNGTGVVTFGDVTGFDASFAPVAAYCSGIDAGVTAADNDNFYLQGYMASATEITITGCIYFNAA